MSPSTSAVRSITGVLGTTDLQHGSDAVLAAAAAVARRADARLHAVHVVTPDAVPRALRARDPETQEDAVEEARRGLWLQTQALEREGTDVASVVVARKRSIHAGIVDVARASGADLIVLGSHARAATSFRLGSTADRVVRTAPVPCLIVRGEPRFPIHRAAVLTDFSAHSRAGVSLALSWLPGLGLDDAQSRLDVIHFAWPEVPEDEGREPERTRRELEREVADLKAAVHHPPHTVRPRVVFSCYPVDATIEEARAQDYQLIVLATRGGGAVSRALIGSVALGLMHAAPCPVLVVPRMRRAP